VRLPCAWTEFRSKREKLSVDPCMNRCCFDCIRGVILVDPVESLDHAEPQRDVICAEIVGSLSMDHREELATVPREFHGRASPFVVAESPQRAVISPLRSKASRAALRYFVDFNNSRTGKPARGGSLCLRLSPPRKLLPGNRLDQPLQEFDGFRAASFGVSPASNHPASLRAVPYRKSARE
jgi:hypothetical protein